MKSKNKVWIVNVIPDENQECGYRFDQESQLFGSLSLEE
jgi:hypothetical protein